MLRFSLLLIMTASVALADSVEAMFATTPELEVDRLAQVYASGDFHAIGNVNPILLNGLPLEEFTGVRVQDKAEVGIRWDGLVEPDYQSAFYCAASDPHSLEENGPQTVGSITKVVINQIKPAEVESEGGFFGFTIPRPVLYAVIIAVTLLLAWFALRWLTSEPESTWE